MTHTCIIIITAGAALNHQSVIFKLMNKTTVFYITQPDLTSDDPGPFIFN